MFSSIYMSSCSFSHGMSSRLSLHSRSMSLTSSSLSVTQMFSTSSMKASRFLCGTAFFGASGALRLTGSAGGVLFLVASSK